MIDLISNDQFFYIEGKPSFRTRSGGLITLIYFVISAIVVYYLAKDISQRKPNFVEY